MTQVAEQVPARRVTPMNDPIDRDNVSAIQLKDVAGGLSFSNMIELMDFAKLMAVSGTAVPQHLRGNPGACMAVCIQAVEWRMSPFAVANKSYSVNDRLAYESAMYHAVACRRAPITGRVKMSYTGKGDTRVCKVWAALADGTGEVEYESPEFVKIKPKNSPLWHNDPDQQLFYFSVRAFVRRHFPDVMSGIYTVDELQDGGAIIGDPPAPTAKGTVGLVEKLKSRQMPVTTAEAMQKPIMSDEEAERILRERSPSAQQGSGSQSEGSNGSSGGDEDQRPNEEQEPQQGEQGGEEQKPAGEKQDAKLEWEDFYSTCREACNESGLTNQQFEDAMRRAMVKAGVVRKEWKFPKGERAALLEACRKGEGFFAKP